MVGADGIFADSILPNLTDDLRRPQYRGNPNLVAGHCYVVAEVLSVILTDHQVKPMTVMHEGGVHWFLYDKINKVPIDPTSSQFSTPVPYDKARGRGFLTKHPSKRARTLLQSMGYTGSLVYNALNKEVA